MKKLVAMKSQAHKWTRLSLVKISEGNLVLGGIAHSLLGCWSDAT